MPKGTLERRSRMISSRLVLTACGALLLILSSAMGSQVSNKVITWGENTSEWNRVLHLGGVRLGCSDAPESCAEAAQRLAKSQGVDTAFLAIVLDPQKTPAYVREYSQLSRSHHALYEVGFDDFVSQCEKQKMPVPALSAMLSDVAQGLKSLNPNLHLGITLYEDELYDPRFPIGSLDAQFRRSVDYVHLYPHYRKESVAFMASVQKAREVFPSAKIVAGLYAYDRRDYLPCARGNSTPCTNQEEINQFTQSLNERLGAVGTSGVEWIEFYPGNFGTEAQWNLWKQPRICNANRLQECIDNTKAMREIVRQTLNR